MFLSAPHRDATTAGAGCSLIARTISLAAAVFTVHADPPYQLPKNHVRPPRSARKYSTFLKVGITLVLTGLIGGGITYYYQERAHLAQQERADLATVRQSALTFLREVGDILEQRRHFALRVLDTIQENAPPEERDQVWKDYMNAVNAWNVKWNLYRALVLEQFGPEMQKRFYDEKADSEATWANYSITGKLMSLHNALEELHNATPDKPPPRCEGDAKALFVYFAGHLRLLFGGHLPDTGGQNRQALVDTGQHPKTTIATLAESRNFRSF